VSDEAIYSLKRREPSLSIRAIAKRLGASKSTVHAVLKAAAHA
jgi:Mn-dependent DtxR family transcriptional regulator